jgi:hypothetical protein
MREILFRGFAPEDNGIEEIVINGEVIKGRWDAGSYMRLYKSTYCFKEDYPADNTEHYIVFDKMTDWGLPNIHIQAEVIPETIGQYTGLEDSNGKMIFEGDIIKADTHFDREIICKIIWRNEYSCYQAEQLGGVEDFINAFSRYEVIGNIFDNPELLEAVKDE